MSPVNVQPVNARLPPSPPASKLLIAPANGAPLLVKVQFVKVPFEDPLSIAPA